MFTSTLKYKAPLSISISVLIIGILFKIMHWPFSDSMLLISITAISFFYILRFFSKINLKFLDYVKLILVLSFSARFIFYVFHLPGKLIPAVIFLCAAGLFTVTIGAPFLIDPEERKAAIENKDYLRLIKNGLVLIGAISIVAGSLFKVMHWQGANVMLILGLIIMAAWAITDLLFTKD
jgi:uncharacterized membrane protein